MTVGVGRYSAIDHFAKGALLPAPRLRQPNPDPLAMPLKRKARPIGRTSVT
jgi:hypothetical protein